MGQQVVQYADKPVSAIVSLTMDFADRMLDGETVTGVSTSNSLFSGTDASPAAMLIGSPTLTGNLAHQAVGGGVVGVLYNIVFYVSTTAYNLYEKTGYLAVIADTGPY
jgi:hypothetical protein